MPKFLSYILVATALVWAQQVSPTINSSPSREFGQPQLLSSLNSIAPNLVEGRELDAPIALAFDTSASPPILYIVDNVDNRVLAYKNPGSLTTCGTGNATCGFADLQIGQRDLTGTLPGCPPDGTGLSTGFALPTGIAVDSSGSVYVADSGNNRILRFPAPFKQTGTLLIPDLIIGQPSIGTNQANQGKNAPSAQTLSLTNRVSALAIDPSGNLSGDRSGNNRVLRFPVSQLAPNTVQPAADVVLGQTDPTLSALPAPPPNIRRASRQGHPERTRRHYLRCQRRDVRLRPIQPRIVFSRAVLNGHTGIPDSGPVGSTIPSARDCEPIFPGRSARLGHQWHELVCVQCRK